MLTLDQLAEQRIREAIAKGEFDDLPGTGVPLQFDDDPLVPEDWRLAYRILKNSGFAPPEVDGLRQIAELERWLEQSPGGEDRQRALTRLDYLRACLDGRCGRYSGLDDFRYRRQLLERLERKSGA
jgi:hypothetical protein